MNEYADVEHALAYLALADKIPHRAEGEAVVLELLPASTRRVLDLGTGDGRLMALLRLARPEIEGLAADFSPPMLKAARERFAGTTGVTLVEYNLQDPMPAAWGQFDAIVSSLAIHHVDDARKKAIYREIFAALKPGGLFANLEHVSSPTPALHEAFFRALGKDVSEEDPSNKCASVEAQLVWLNEIGYRDVDCYWKWRELAVLAGYRPS
jgi:tRNA (cmo5U34)-methyltransferase